MIIKMEKIVKINKFLYINGMRNNYTSFFFNIKVNIYFKY